MSEAVSRGMRMSRMLCEVYFLLCAIAGVPDAWVISGSHIFWDGFQLSSSVYGPRGFHQNILQRH